MVVSDIVYFHPYKGRWSNLTSIFFRWVGSTTNQNSKYWGEITHWWTHLWSIHFQLPTSSKLVAPGTLNWRTLCWPESAGVISLCLGFLLRKNRSLFYPGRLLWNIIVRGLVQIMFLSRWVMCFSSILIFQGVFFRTGHLVSLEVCKVQHCQVSSCIYTEPPEPKNLHLFSKTWRLFNFLKPVLDKKMVSSKQNLYLTCAKPRFYIWALKFPVLHSKPCIFFSLGLLFLWFLKL